MTDNITPHVEQQVQPVWCCVLVPQRSPKRHETGTVRLRRKSWDALAQGCSKGGQRVLQLQAHLRMCAARVEQQQQAKQQ